jgi:hypothetical protein
MNDEIKTVTHEGQVYQLGKVYSFSHDHKHKCERRLKGVDKGNTEYPFIDHANVCWRYIKAIDSSELGTITPAPIELVDGAAYTFDYNKNRKSAIGVYSKCHNTFLTVGHDYFVFDCSNIRLMTVESK